MRHTTRGERTNKLWQQSQVTTPFAWTSSSIYRSMYVLQAEAVAAPHQPLLLARLRTVPALTFLSLACVAVGEAKSYLKHATCVWLCECLTLLLTNKRLQNLVGGRSGNRGLHIKYSSTGPQQVRSFPSLREENNNTLNFCLLTPNTSDKVYIGPVLAFFPRKMKHNFLGPRNGGFWVGAKGLCWKNVCAFSSP